MTINLALTEEHFRTLVQGGIVVDKAVIGDGAVEVPIVVKIILSDIGFERMRWAVEDAEREARRNYGDRTR